MAKEQVTFTIKFRPDKSYDEMLALCRDIGELYDFIPEWHEWEVEEIQERILERIKRILKLEQSGK